MDKHNGATLVVGADSDIGSALVKRLNGTVIAHYFLFPDKLDDAPDGTVKISGDLSNEQGILDFIAEVNATGLTVERIVHLPSAPAVANRFRKFDTARFMKGLYIQYISAALIFREFLPKMAKAKFGRVAAILTSYCIGVPPKYLSEYVSTKYAMMGLCKALAAEYAANGITVNAVAPSMVDTKFLSTLPEFEIEANAKANPTGRNASVDDVVNGLLFLLSDESEYINGAVIPITGGSAF